MFLVIFFFLYQSIHSIIIFAVSITNNLTVFCCCFFIGNSASAKPTLQRYPLRSANKLKEQKPDASSDSINRSQSKRYFLSSFFFSSIIADFFQNWRNIAISSEIRFAFTWIV
jgi:hypothetical protein